MTSGFNIAPPGYTPDNHPQRGERPERSTIDRMLGVAAAVVADLDLQRRNAVPLLTLASITPTAEEIAAQTAILSRKDKS